MKKNFLQTLLVVVLSVIGVSQCWAEETKSYYPFSHVGHKGGLYWDYEAINKMSYDGLNNKRGANIYSDATYGDGLYLATGGGGFAAGTKSGFIGLYEYTRSVESYTKVVLTYSYSLSSFSCGYTPSGFTVVYRPQVVALYKFDDENTAKTTSVDWTYDFANQEGAAYRVAYTQHKGNVAGWLQPSGSTKFVFDNLAGTTSQSISKYITVVLCEGQPTEDAYFVSHIAALKCTNAEYAYTYRKIITFDGNGGSGSMSQQTIDDKGNLTTNALTRTGYTFNGWNTQADGTGTAYANGAEITATADSKGPVTLYAQWTPITYNITYNVNGGSEITEPNTYTIETETFDLPVPTKNGYDFDGWFANSTYAGDQITQIVKGSTENKTFYAKWTAVNYTITYNSNDGSAITEHLNYTIETATFALPKPTKDGYTFGGWFTNEDCTEGQTTQIAQGSTGNKTFYAKWSENVVSDGSNKTLSEAQNEVNTALSTWVAECAGSKAINLTINRTIYKDGYYNTLCLPFDMSAAQIAATFGTYKELKQFASATVQGSGSSRSIVIEVENATEIEAGKAYLISFEEGTDITTLTFNNVIVSTTEAPNEPGTLAYQGILAPYQLPYENQDYLFLGEKNTLYWPINDGKFMKGFRAYFKVNTNSAGAPYRPGMRAAFGGGQTPTDLSPAVSGQEVRKLLEQGRIVIVNKGVKYNMNGATVQ